MRRKFLALLIALFMVATVLSACEEDEVESSKESEIDNDSKYDDSEDSESEKSAKNSSESWVFYWYICGSDLESENGCATLDLEELMSVELPENVKVVFETGGSSEWYNDLISSEKLTRGVYSSEGLEIVEELPSANMGSAETLSDFLSFCNKNYPADKRGVLFWNHGGGSVSGLAFDELYNFDALQLSELSYTFEEQDTGDKYELVGFDSCLMATIDVADTFDEYANYMVASEEMEPGCGWSYDIFFEALTEKPSMDGAELGRIICDSFYTGCEDIGQEDGVTLSVIDLSEVKNLVEAYNAVGKEVLISAGEDEGYMTEFSRSAYSSENYGGNNDFEGYTNMVDMGDLVRNAMNDELLSERGTELLEALDQAIVYKINGDLREKSSGLSCYYSYNGDYDDFSYFSRISASPAFSYYFDYLLTGEVSDELIQYAREEEQVPQISENSFSSVPISSPDEFEDHAVDIIDDNTAVLNLGKEKADKLSSVYFNLAYLDDESNMMIYLGQDNDIIFDWENGVFQDNFRGVWGSIDGCLVYMELSDEAENYQIYAVPILLNGEEYVLSVSYDFNSEEYEILGARRSIDDNGMTDKFLRVLEPGDVIEPLHYVIEDYELDEEPEIMPIEELTVTEETTFEEIDLGDGIFFMLFEMKDNRGNSFESEAVLIIYKDGEIEFL